MDVGMSQHMAGDQRSAVIHCRGALLRPVATPHADFMRHGLNHRIRALCVLARTQWACGDADDAVKPRATLWPRPTPSTIP